MPDDRLDRQLADLRTELLAREQARLDCLLDIIADYRHELLVVIDRSAAAPEARGRWLFKHVTDALRTLELQVIHPGPVPTPTGLRPQPLHDTLIHLSWALRYPAGKPNHVYPEGQYVLWPTARGLAVVDRLRAAIGELPAMQQLQANRTALKQHIERVRTELGIHETPID